MLANGNTSLSGDDSANFEVVGNALYLKAGVCLDYETKASYTVDVNIVDRVVPANSVTASYTLAVLDVNEAPTAVTLANKVSSLAENTSTAGRIRVADIVVSDDALGTNTISLFGADAGSFEVDGTGLYLKAGVALDYERRATYALTVNVADTRVAGSQPVSTSYTLAVTNVNEAPTALALTNQVTSLAETTSTASRVKVADIAISDDALGTNSIWLLGPDAASFEVVGSALYLRAGEVLDYETKGSYAVTVNVADSNTSGSSPVSTPYTLNIADANEAPTAVSLSHVAGVLAENTNTASRIKVADILVSDDALGTNTASLSGADAGSFEVVGSALYLRAGVSLDYETKTAYAVTVNVADASVAGSVPVTAAYTLAVQDVDDTPATVQAVRIASAAGVVNGVLDSGDTLTLEVEMSRAVALSGGSPTLALDIGGVTKQATYNGLSGDGKTLSFSYTLPDGVMDADGISLHANSFALGAGTALTTVGNGLGAVLTHVAVADDAAYKVGPKMLGVLSRYFDADTYGFVSVRSDTIGAAMLHDTDAYNGYTVSMPKLDGKALANAAITLSWADGAQTRNVTANGSGTWSYALTHADLASMGAGQETVSASYSDGHGHSVISTHDIRVNALAQTTLGAPGSGYGSTYIDALVHGGAGWAYPTITYSFAQAADGSVTDWTALEMQTFRDACQLYSNVCNVQFFEGVFSDNDAESTNIKLFKYTSNEMSGGADAGAEFYQPVDLGYANRVVEGHFNVDHWSAPSPGSYAYYATIHELAHGLGLDHPFDSSPVFPGVSSNGNGGYTRGDHELNGGIWTILSYNFDWPQESYIWDDQAQDIVAGMSQTPMSFDIAAVQALYGANMTYRTGDDTYVIPDTVSIQGGWACIWDAGGIDTISHAGATSACTINLNAYPKTGGVDSVPYVSYAPGAPVGFTIADGVTIENAVGGNGDDTLTGNAAANQLTGGGGADRLTGGGGADRFVFAAALDAGNVDTITDFNAVQGDQIVLRTSVFTALDGLSDVSGLFLAGAGATSAASPNDVLIYDTTDGALYYDADGAGGGASAVQFALFATLPTLASSDFVLLA